MLGRYNAAPSEGGPQRWRILIVEDDPIIALDLSSIVTSAGMAAKALVVAVKETAVSSRRRIESPRDRPVASA